MLSGIPLVIGAGRLIAANLHGVASWDPVSLSAAAGALAICALFAALIPGQPRGIRFGPWRHCERSRFQDILTPAVLRPTWIRNLHSNLGIPCGNSRSRGVLWLPRCSR
jgi:hypothetical protein